jgi:hypothetical protein
VLFHRIAAVNARVPAPAKRAGCDPSSFAPQLMPALAES